MYNVDTITLQMLTKRFIIVTDADGKKHRKIDRAYTDNMTLKMIDKLKLTEENRQNRAREIRYNRLTNCNKEVLSKITKKSRKKLKVNWFGRYKGYSFNFNETWSSLTVMVSHSHIETYTADEIIENTKKIIMEYFELESKYLNEITLNRLDIHCDYRYEDDEELKIIKNILEQKAPNEIYSYKKRPKKNNSNAYIYTYSAIRKNDKEDTAIVINGKENLSNYIEVEIYDKELHIKYLMRIGRAGEKQLKKYKKIFRTEVRLRNGKINSNKHKGIKATKKLQEYYNEETTTEIYNAIIQKIFGILDFYRIDIALMHIKGNANARPKKIGRMCELVDMINKFGYSTAKQICIKRYSENTFRNYIKEIENLGINVLTFDRAIDGVEIKREKIKNFTSLVNTVPESRNLKVRSAKSGDGRRYIKKSKK